MFCPQCGKELQDGEVCSCQQAQPQGEQTAQNQTAAQTTVQAAPEQSTAAEDWKGNEKLFSILSYIGILWLIGLLVNPEKGDSKVRFHVGQGIILTIADAVIGIVMGIISAIINGIFRTEITILGYGTGVYETSAVATVLTTIISLAGWVLIVFLVVKGIMNVVNKKQEPLPIIGKLAFYK